MMDSLRHLYQNHPVITGLIIWTGFQLHIVRFMVNEHPGECSTNYASQQGVV